MQCGVVQVEWEAPTLTNAICSLPNPPDGSCYLCSPIDPGYVLLGLMDQQQQGQQAGVSGGSGGPAGMFQDAASLLCIDRCVYTCQKMSCAGQESLARSAAAACWAAAHATERPAAHCSTLWLCLLPPTAPRPPAPKPQLARSRGA